MNTERFFGIMGLILIVLALLFSVLLMDSFYGKKKDAAETIRSMVIDAMFIAIILIMTFVPNVGYITITPLISFTLLHLPVLLGAGLFGWKKGFFLGFIFGCSSYIQAATGGVAGLNLLFAYPWVAIPPRAIFGLLAGIAFSLIRKLHKGGIKGLYLGLAAALLTLLHTVLVFGDLLIFFPEQVGGLLTSSTPLAEGTALTFFLVIVIGMAGEMALSAFLIPPLTLAIVKAAPRLTKLPA